MNMPQLVRKCCSKLQMATSRLPRFLLLHPTSPIKVSLTAPLPSMHPTLPLPNVLGLAPLVPLRNLLPPSRPYFNAKPSCLHPRLTPPNLPQSTHLPHLPFPRAHIFSHAQTPTLYDKYLSSTYSVHCREGWVYRGSRSMIWLPDDFRPASPTSLSAIDDRLVIFTGSRSGRLVFFDLRSMVGTILQST
ncbi:hypothetical protein BS17DRAFT_282711 [Gyrodon lividus]|nr:hypothetical protein BS17DRAFT_282711 [Gyrodon lividus]